VTCVFFTFLMAISTSKALGSGTSGSAICIAICLTSLNPMYIQQLRETALPLSQYIVGVCKQITLLIFYYISSSLATPLKVTGVPIQVSDILDLTVSFKFNNFSFQIFLLFVLKCLPISRLTFCGLSTLLWFGSCIHCF